jgi:DNA-binding transcriptional ArsR family regulator
MFMGLLLLEEEGRPHVQLQSKDDLLTRRLDVTDAKVAKLFEDGRRRKLLLSLVGKERTLTDAALANGMTLNLAHYHVTQLLGHGLVRVVREQKRNGRPIRYYTSEHWSFFVPGSLLRSRPAEKLSRELAAALQHQRDLAGGGVLFDVDPAGRPRMREITGGADAPLEIWRRLNLPRQEAAALFDELSSVINKYHRDAARGTRAWTLHLALGQTD